MRQLALTRVQMAECRFLLLSLVNEWGEDDAILADALLQGYDEVETLKILRFVCSRASPGTLILDVGAYVGLFSFVAALSSPNLHVIAFEPSTPTYGRLLTNICLNKLDMRITPAHLAVGPDVGRMPLKHRYGVYSITSGDSSVLDFQPDHTEEVTMVPLNALIGDHTELPAALASPSIPRGEVRGIDLIKIDVEGGELQVLTGAGSVVKRYQPVIICEVLSDDLIAGIDDYCAAHSYKYLRIQDERNILMVPSSRYGRFLSDFEAWKGKEDNALNPVFERSLLLTV